MIGLFPIAAGMIKGSVERRRIPSTTPLVRWTLPLTTLAQYTRRGGGGNDAVAPGLAAIRSRGSFTPHRPPIFPNDCRDGSQFPFEGT